MDFATFIHTDLFRLGIVPVLICLARVCDVTLDTLRIIYVSRGLKHLAAFIGFFEVLIWLMAITQILSNMTNVSYYLAYAFGFAMGNFIGIIVEERMAIGSVVIRVITQKDAAELVQSLRDKGFGLTHIDGQGALGPVKVLFTIVKRKDVEEVLDMVKKFNPLAFYTIEDIRSVNKGVFPLIKKPDHHRGTRP